MEEANSLSTCLSWVELNGKALANNLRVLRTTIGPDAKLIAVVKADAYGHGAVSVAKIALAHGAWGLAVSSLQEALPLRSSGVVAPILLLNHLPTREAILLALENDLTVSVYDSEIAAAYDESVRIALVSRLGDGDRETYQKVPRLKVHLKIDSGMGRLGVGIEEAGDFFRLVRNLPRLEIEGIYSHLARADETDCPSTSEQLSTFERALQTAEDLGLSFRIVHIANSAAAFSRRDAVYDGVRIGLAMYGVSPFDSEFPGTKELEPVLTWKTRVAQVKRYPRGTSIGYGGTYRTSSDPEIIAVLPVGYADGIRRGPLPWKTVLIRGEFVPVVGRVCMEKIAVNVTALTPPLVQCGEEVVLIGTQGNNRQGAQDVALAVGTSAYEILCAVGARVPRKWIYGGKKSTQTDAPGHGTAVLDE